MRKSVDVYEDLSYWAKEYAFTDIERLYFRLNVLLRSISKEGTQASGLIFKPAQSYFEAHSGEICWTMAVEYDYFRVCLAHRKPEGVLKKAIYFFEQSIAGNSISEEMMDRWEPPGELMEPRHKKIRLANFANLNADSVVSIPATPKSDHNEDLPNLD